MKTIIIGSGAAGLTAGAYLAQKGSDVIVLEGTDTVGGALAHVKKDGYEWSRNYLLQRFLPGQYFADFLSASQEPVKAVRIEQKYVFPDFVWEKPDGAQGRWMQKLLTEKYPAEKRGLKKLFDFCDRVRTIAAAQEKIETNDSAALKRSVIWNFLFVNRYVDMRADRFLNTMIRDENLKRILTAVLLEKGVGPTEFAAIGLPMLISEALFDGTLSLKGKNDLEEPGGLPD